MAEWEQIAEIAIDSGTVWIGDPSYGVGPDHKNAATDWKPFVEKAQSLGLFTQGFARFDSPQAIGTLGLIVQTGGGDGLYPVFVRRGPDGSVAEARIVFEEPSSN